MLLDIIIIIIIIIIIMHLSVIIFPFKCQIRKLSLLMLKII